MGNLKNVKDSYKPTEWTLREGYYLAELDKINIPTDIKTADIKILESMIDTLYSEVSMDMAYVKRKYDALERSKKILEQELFLIIKGQAINGLKTVDEVKGAIAIALKVIVASDVLSNKPIDTRAVENAILDTLANKAVVTPSTTTLLQAIRLYEEREIFLAQIIDVLKNKHSALITDEGALKLENDIARTGGNNNG